MPSLLFLPVGRSCRHALFALQSFADRYGSVVVFHQGLSELESQCFTKGGETALPICRYRALTSYPRNCGRAKEEDDDDDAEIGDDDDVATAAY